MKKIVSILAAIAMLSVLLAGCAKTTGQTGKTTPSPTVTTAPTAAPTATPTPTKAPVKKVKIGLSTDEGGLNDKSFNQSADTGIKKAQTEFGLDYKAIESKTKDDYEANLEALIADKSDLVFGVGFQMEAALKATAEKHKDQKFAIIDANVPLPNVESISFKEEEGSFLVGVIAGKMTKTNKIGFIGGKDFDVINRFEAGFAAGVKSVNPAAAEGLISKDGKAFGTMVKYVDDFGDPNKGYEAAKALYGAGCDIVYHAAGGVGIGLFKAAKELKDGGKAVWAIGVDMDQAVSVTDTAGKPMYADVILTSMIKRVDTGTYNATKEVVDNKFQGGKAIVLGLKENGVGVAPSSDKNVPKDILDLVTKYSDAIKGGKLVVPPSRDAATKFAPVAVQ